MNILSKSLKKISGHFKEMNSVRKLNGIYVVVLLYLDKFSFLRVFLSKKLVKANILGSTMYLKVTDRGLHRRLLLSGIREEEHTGQLQENILPGMVGVELGANIGYFALLEAQRVGSTGKIYCIEPETDNLRLLNKNIAANNFQDRTKVFQYLIGDHDGVEKLHLSKYGNVHSVSAVRNKEGSIDVPMVTLDTFMDQNNLKPEDVDFLRMDIEGYEVKAFDGMKKIMESKMPFKIFMEFHPMYYPDWGWTFEKLLRHLDSLGFKVVEIAQKKNILKNPSIEAVLKMHENNNGSQAFLERL